jgi:hypothetical protein
MCKLYRHPRLLGSHLANISPWHGLGAHQHVRIFPLRSFLTLLMSGFFDERKTFFVRSDSALVQVYVHRKRIIPDISRLWHRRAEASSTDMNFVCSSATVGQGEGLGETFGCIRKWYYKRICNAKAAVCNSRFELLPRLLLLLICCGFALAWSSTAVYRRSSSIWG